MLIPRAPIWLALGVVLSLQPAHAFAQSADNVLVVINDASPKSVRIGEYYAQKRGIAADHVARITAPIADGITRADYERTIEGPIASWLLRRDLQDRVLYIVLTSGVPLRIVGTSGLKGTISSVDSELTLLYRRLLGIPVLPAGRVPNPYFLDARPLSDATRFTRATADIFLVTRLDGFTEDDVIKLIDRAAAPAAKGLIVLDQKAAPGDRGGDLWLREAADRLGAAGSGDSVLIETTKALATTPDPVLGYFSWGSNDPAGQSRQTGLKFADGAIGGLFVSTDGRTFREPPDTWTPSGPPTAFGEQSLAGDLIREGITGVSAQVAEPYLDAIVRPQILFPAYVSGLNLAEAFYLATPFLSWQQVVIGDPLCAVARRAPIPASTLDKGLDGDTGLPVRFSERRLALMKASGLKIEGLKLSLKADGLLAKGASEAEVDAVLIAATAVEPGLVAAQFRLASRHESRDEFDQAIARYRAVITADSEHFAALNNLAYLLSEKKNAAAEALPLAEKAYRLSARAPVVADTLGWVHHLLGDDRTALPLIEHGLAGAPKSAEIHFHAAVVHAALGNKARALTLLEAAVKLDPGLATRSDVQGLRARLGKQ